MTHIFCAPKLCAAAVLSLWDYRCGISQVLICKGWMTLLRCYGLLDLPHDKYLEARTWSKCSTW